MAFKNKADAIKYNNDYNKANYDDLRIVVPKGKKQLIKQHAENEGVSLNHYVNVAIDEKMERDNKTPD